VQLEAADRLDHNHQQAGEFFGCELFGDYFVTALRESRQSVGMFLPVCSIDGTTVRVAIDRHTQPPQLLQQQDRILHIIVITSQRAAILYTR